MALSTHLFLTIEGVEVEGESTISSLEREGSIECTNFKMGAHVSVDQSGMTGKRQYQPIEFRKRIDISSPLLLDAMATNKRVEAEFRFYQPNPGSGDEEHYYTVRVSDGIINSVQYEAEALDPEKASWPGYELVQISFRVIYAIHEVRGVEFEDDLSGSA